MDSNEIELSGNVIARIFSPGSKSEHNAVWFETTQGTYKLRRKAGNPFSDPILTELIGKQIQARGIISDYLFLISSYTVLS